MYASNHSGARPQRSTRKQMGLPLRPVGASVERLRQAHPPGVPRSPAPSLAIAPSMRPMTTQARWARLVTLAIPTRLATWLALSVVIVLAGCDIPGTSDADGDADPAPATPEPVLVLPAPEKMDTLTAYADRTALRSDILRRIRERGSQLTAAPPLPDDDAAPGEADSDLGVPGMDPATPSNPGYTGTNLQEQAVDEADFCKTDGEHIYVASSSTLSVLTGTHPPEAVATLEAPGPITGLFLRGTRLTVLYRLDTLVLDTAPAALARIDRQPIGPVHDGAEPTPQPAWIARQRCGVLLCSVADPQAPAVLRDLRFDGGLRTSRFIDDRLLLVLDNKLTGTGWAGSVQADDEPEFDLCVPHWFETDPVTGISTRGGWLPGTPARCYRSPDDQGTTATVILTLDTADPQAEPDAALVAGWHHTTYVSSNAIYLASRIYKDTPNAETGYDLRYHTLIKALTLADMAPLGCGSVWGRPLGRWAFGEHDGVLRVATTTGWGDEMRNHLFCLRPDDEGALESVGSVEDLAPGQRIYAVRYRGTWAYVVTYRRVDPLHVIDVSDPTAPVERGELWLPGFSDYLHPIGDGLLIGLGEDENGHTKLSLFDVSDPTAPVERHSHVLGSKNLNSEARYDHRAFAYRDADRLLALPFSDYSYATCDLGHKHWHNSQGALIVDVDPEHGFTNRGRIPFDNDVYAWSNRAILIDENGFAVCPQQIASNPLTELEEEPERLDLPVAGD